MTICESFLPKVCRGQVKKNHSLDHRPWDTFNKLVPDHFIIAIHGPCEEQIQKGYPAFWP